MAGVPERDLVGPTDTGYANGDDDDDRRV